MEISRWCFAVVMVLFNRGEATRRKRRGRKEEMGMDDQGVELFISRRIGSEQEGETRVLRLGEHVARCNGIQLISQPVEQ
jgi:hypothetical protein